MKKYFKSENENKSGKWSEGFSNTKTGKPVKTNKPKKTDTIEFENGSVVLVDETAEVAGITGMVSFFAIAGASLVVNGVKKI